MRKRALKDVSSDDGQSHSSGGTKFGTIQFNAKLFFSINPEKEEGKVTSEFSDMRFNTSLGKAQGDHVISHRLMLEMCAKKINGQRITDVPTLLKEAFEEMCPDLNDPRSEIKGKIPVAPALPTGFAKKDKEVESLLAGDDLEIYKIGLRCNKIKEVEIYVADLISWYSAMPGVVNKKQGAKGRGEGIETSAAIVALNSINEVLKLGEEASAADKLRFAQESLGVRGDYVNGMRKVFYEEGKKVKIGDVRKRYKMDEKGSIDSISDEVAEDFFKDMVEKSSNADIIGRIIERGFFDFPCNNKRKSEASNEELIKQSVSCLKMVFGAFPELENDKEEISKSFLKSVKQHQGWKINKEITIRVTNGIKEKAAISKEVSNGADAANSTESTSINMDDVHVQVFLSNGNSSLNFAVSNDGANDDIPRSSSLSDGSKETEMGEYDFNAKLFFSIDLNKENGKLAASFSDIRFPTHLGKEQGDHVISHRLMLEMCAKILSGEKVTRSPEILKEAFERLFPEDGEWPEITGKMQSADKEVTAKLKTTINQGSGNIYEMGIRYQRIKSVKAYVSEIVEEYSKLPNITNKRAVEDGKKNGGKGDDEGSETHASIVALNAINEFIELSNKTDSDKIEFTKKALATNGEFVHGMRKLEFTNGGGPTSSATTINENIESIRHKFNFSKRLKPKQVSLHKENEAEKVNSFIGAMESKSKDAGLIGKIIGNGFFDLKPGEGIDVEGLELMSSSCLNMAFIAFPELEKAEGGKAKIAEAFLDNVIETQGWSEISEEQKRELYTKIKGAIKLCEEVYMQQQNSSQGNTNKVQRTDAVDPRSLPRSSSGLEMDFGR